jgi:hypothetical protein
VSDKPTSNEITFTGRASGDMECFCWDDVPKEDVIKIKGQDVYDNEMELEMECELDMADCRGIEPNKEEIKEIANKTVSRIYPSCVIAACLGIKESYNVPEDKVYKFTIKVEEV